MAYQASLNMAHPEDEPWLDLLPPEIIVLIAGYLATCSDLLSFSHVNETIFRIVAQAETIWRPFLRRLDYYCDLSASIPSNSLNCKAKDDFLLQMRLDLNWKTANYKRSEIFELKNTHFNIYGGDCFFQDLVVCIFDMCARHLPDSLTKLFVVYDEENGIRCGEVPIPNSSFNYCGAVSKNRLVVQFNRRDDSSALLVVDVTKFQIVWLLELNVGTSVVAANNQIYLFGFGLITVLSAETGQKVSHVRMQEVIDPERFARAVCKVEEKVPWVSFMARCHDQDCYIFAFNTDTLEVLQVCEASRRKSRFFVLHDRLVVCHHSERNDNTSVYRLPSLKLVHQSSQNTFVVTKYCWASNDLLLMTYDKEGVENSNGNCETLMTIYRLHEDGKATEVLPAWKEIHWPGLSSWQFCNHRLIHRHVIMNAYRCFDERVKECFVSTNFCRIVSKSEDTVVTLLGVDHYKGTACSMNVVGSKVIVPCIDRFDNLVVRSFDFNVDRATPAHKSKATAKAASSGDALDYKEVTLAPNSGDASYDTDTPSDIDVDIESVKDVDIETSNDVDIETSNDVDIESINDVDIENSNDAVAKSSNEADDKSAANLDGN